MVVVGAARSGIAAAELLVRRGASVTLTEKKSSSPCRLMPCSSERRKSSVELGTTVTFGRSSRPSRLATSSGPVRSAATLESISVERVATSESTMPAPSTALFETYA